MNYDEFVHTPLEPEAVMNTALQIKVVSVILYVAVSTALVLMLSEEPIQSAVQTLFGHSLFR